MLLEQCNQIVIAEFGHSGRELGRLRGPICRGHRRVENPCNCIAVDGYRLDVIGVYLLDEGGVTDCFSALRSTLTQERWQKPRQHEEHEQEEPGKQFRPF